MFRTSAPGTRFRQIRRIKAIRGPRFLTRSSSRYASCPNLISPISETCGKVRLILGSPMRAIASTRRTKTLARARHRRHTRRHCRASGCERRAKTRGTRSHDRRGLADMADSPSESIRAMGPLLRGATLRDASRIVIERKEKKTRILSCVTASTMTLKRFRIQISVVKVAKLEILDPRAECRAIPKTFCTLAYFRAAL